MDSLPSYQYGNLEISLRYDPAISSINLIAVFQQRDSRTLEVVERKEAICKALPIESTIWDRHVYVREVCELISRKLKLDSPSLSLVEDPIHIMCESWDIFGVFMALERINDQHMERQKNDFFDQTELRLSQRELSTIHRALSGGIGIYSNQPGTTPSQLSGDFSEDIETLRTKISSLVRS